MQSIFLKFKMQESLNLGLRKRRDELLKIFLKKHPTLRAFAEAKTTVLDLIEAERHIHVNGFQSLTVWELKSQAQ